MTNSISFSWDIHYACNYRCPYCWFDGRWHELSRQNRYLPLDEVLKPWRNIYKKYGSAYIELIGGEPFIYPHFTELIKELSQMHTIGITTNLSIDLEDFIKQVDISKVKVTPTFHPLFADFDKFSRRMSLLKESGIGFHIFYLAYPPQMKLIQYYSDKFNSFGMPMEVLTFWGKYKDKSYPQGYTQEEKKLIEPSLSCREGEKFQLEPKLVKGKLCRAGQIYANIKADGSVFRCGGNDGEPIGNLFSNGFKLLDKPLPCKSDFCPCNEWAPLLIEEKAPVGAGKDKNALTEEPSFRNRVDRSPKYPRKDPPYRVYRNWEINYKCNYKCSYCGAKGKDDQNIYPSFDNIVKGWDQIYDKYGSCVIHISGGEPCVYPRFSDLAYALTRRHLVELITNLSFDIRNLIDNIGPQNIHIGASFHPEYVDLETFVRKLTLLINSGFYVWVNYVAYPLQLKPMKLYKDEIEKLGIKFAIQPFKGEYDGRVYPAGYTTSEKCLLKACSGPEDDLNSPRIEREVTDKKRQNKGRLCRMGQMYAAVYPEGETYRCCVKNKENYLGNLFNGDFKLLDTPANCENEICQCWRCMIVGEENKWLSFWELYDNKTLA
jgi:MoaA/NifB/PqqE/SkfB family radical SAM enzyme